MNYIITDEPDERIELKVDNGKFALVKTWGHNDVGYPYTVIILNKREVLKLYQAIQDEMVRPFDLTTLKK